MTVCSIIMNVLLPRAAFAALLGTSTCAWFSVRLGLYLQAVAIDVFIDACLKLRVPASKWMDRHRRFVFVVGVVIEVAMLLHTAVGLRGGGMHCGQPSAGACSFEMLSDSFRTLPLPCLALRIAELGWLTASATATLVGRLLVWIGGLGPFSQMSTLIVGMGLAGRVR